jgi:hypothetical protein
MSRGPWIAFFIVLLALNRAGADENDNWQRLRAIPREQRIYLADKIIEFDRLTSSEQEAIRELDNKISSLPPGDRANYRSVLRRYHNWLRNLPEDQRKRIADAPPEKRMAVVAELRAEHAGQRTGMGDGADLRLNALGPSVFEVAHLVKSWNALTDAERAQVERRPVRQRPQQLLKIAQEKGVEEIHLDSKKVDELFKEFSASPRGAEFAKSRWSEKGDPSKKQQDRPAFRQRVAESYYFSKNPVHPVAPENLFRFESGMPSWIRNTFDPLPPDAARRRLSMVYRLIYDYPEEMPIPPKATKPAAPPQNAPAAPAAPV